MKNSQLPTKAQKRRQTRRGKGGTKAVARQALASVVEPDSEATHSTRSVSLTRQVGKEYRVAAAVVGIHAGYYDTPQITKVVVEALHRQLSV